MKQITQLLPEDLGKELYELWEVSIHTGLVYTDLHGLSML